MKFHGIILNDITLGLLIDGFIKCNQVEKAERVLENE